jgi:VanZ family protein
MNRAISGILLRLLQLGFAAALIFTFVAAVMPPHKAPKLFPWDKAEHFTAFFTLMLIAVAAFPRRNLVLIAVLLSAFGGLIEIVQGMPIVGRDCDVWDWVADTIAILAVIAPVVAMQWRAMFRAGA